MVEERRDCVRVDTSRPVEFIVNGRGYFGSIANISGGGAFVDTSQFFQVGQDIAMKYSFTNGEENRSGQVVRSTSQGIGVKFNFPGYYSSGKR